MLDRAGDLRAKLKKMALLMGIASHDVVAAKLVCEKALKQGVGVKLWLLQLSQREGI